MGSDEHDELEGPTEGRVWRALASQDQDDVGRCGQAGFNSVKCRCVRVCLRLDCKGVATASHRVKRWNLALAQTQSAVLACGLLSSTLYRERVASASHRKLRGTDRAIAARSEDMLRAVGMMSIES